jgi:hypothetical protein
VGDDQSEWLAEYGQPIREQPTEAVDYDNQPLKSLENPATSKLWVAGSSPAGRARFSIPLISLTKINLQFLAGALIFQKVR